MDEGLLKNHVEEINRCNQRGGRMLSLVDLIDAGSADLPTAAWLAAAMRAGSSLLVGARPGAAGKTAVMCALLNFLPDETGLQAADTWPLPEAESAAAGEVCFLAHEIGAGPYYAYVWGEAARGFFSLTEAGRLIASNLHADTLEEARDQLCGENGVALSHFRNVRLKIFLRMKSGLMGGTKRWIYQVYESDGGEDRLVWERPRPDGESKRLLPDSSLVTPEQEKQMAGFLADLQRRNIRAVEDVRRLLLAG